ncbi:MAG: hypothetical protein KC415_19635 [Anaerolineales bacterium]|nr:hypothetical protein [Anaerolineales bacterium]
MTISIHIEHLLLEGIDVSPSQREVLGTAVATELTRLLTANGLSPNLQTGAILGHIPAGTFQLTGNNNPTHLGQQIAQAVYGGIGNGNENNGR